MKTNLLTKLLTETNDVIKMTLLLKALFTSKELKELDNRLSIFQMLLKGKNKEKYLKN